MATPVKSHKKLVTLLFLFTLGIATMALYFGVVRHQVRAVDIKVDGIYLTEPQTIATFHLTDNTGSAFTEANLKGHWTVLFFGFTNCGMICPTTMASLNEMYKTLQQELPDNQLPQVVMISVDPERDTVARMNEYVKAFNPHFMGARGDEAETTAMERQFHIAAAKMQADGAGSNHYTVNHTAEIIVINPRGQLQAFLSYPHKAAELVTDFKAILRTPLA